MNYKSIYHNITIILLLILILIHTNAFVSRYTSCIDKKLGLSMISIESKADIKILAIEHQSFLKNIGKVDNIPTRLETLLSLLHIRGDELVRPTERSGLNPFLIPIAKSKVDDSTICYIRWPTQKEDMDLQIVKTNPIGINLIALGTDQLCKRIITELDFFASESLTEAQSIIQSSKLAYERDEVNTFLKSGKFPVLTEDDRRLVLDKYLLSKVGAFPDCYERIANNFYKQGSEVSALVTCERAVSVFYGWGHPMHFHATFLSKLDGRDKEARDTARAAMFTPKWTMASSKQELEDLIKLAGFTSIAVVGEMHAFRASDPRTKDVEEGLSPIQVTLDQAGHLMDAVALGSIEGGWDSVKELLADKYRDGGYAHIADFILS